MNVLLSRLGDFCATYKSKTPYGVYSGEWVKIIRLHTYTHSYTSHSVSLGTALTMPVDRELCLHTMYGITINYVEGLGVLHYYCHAASQHEHLKCNIVILIVPPPNVTIVPNDVTAKVYGSVMFVCSAVGLGDLSFQWESSNSVLTNERSLTINSVLPSHQGQYKCIVTSSYSNLNSDAFATLHVKGNHLHINC